MFAVLTRLNATVFLESGSALGQRRHNGTQVPWEYDADIGVMIHEEWSPPGLTLLSYHEWFMNLVKEPELAELQHIWMKTPYSVPKPGQKPYCVQYEFGIDLSPQYGPGNKGMHTQIDLFGYELIAAPPDAPGEEEREAKVKYIGGCFPSFGLHLESNVLPPANCLFYGNMVKCPRNIDAYLKQAYGSTVLTVGQSHYDYYSQADRAAMWNKYRWWVFCIAPALVLLLCVLLQRGFLRSPFRSPPPGCALLLTKKKCRGGGSQGTHVAPEGVGGLHYH